MRRQTPLPVRAEEAFEVLRPAIDSTDDGLPRDEAAALLADGAFDPGEADDQLAVLLERGYLYAVNDLLRVTA